MPRHLRRRFFYALIALFCVLGTGAVLYAQGWRVTVWPLELGKVGAIYVRTFPADARVALDGKPQEREFALFGRATTLITDLLPGNYTLTVEAEGFQPYRRQVAVRSSFVSRLEYIALIPKETTAVTTTPLRSIAKAGDALVLERPDGLQTLGGASLQGDTFLAASEDGNIVLTYASTTHNYLATTLSQPTTTPLRGLPFAERTGAPAAFEPMPGENGMFILRREGNLALVRTSASDAIRLSTSSIAIASIPGRIMWAEFDAKSHASLLSFYEPGPRSFGRNIDSLPGRVVSLAMRGPQELFVLTDDGSLYSLNTGQSSRARLAQGVRSIALSPNGAHLAAVDAQGLRVFFLRSEQPQVAFALPDAARVRRLLWYRDGEHVFVEYPDRVAFLELDDPALQNFATVAPSGMAEYQAAVNTLYFVKDGQLFKVVFPGI